MHKKAYFDTVLHNLAVYYSANNARVAVKYLVAESNTGDEEAKKFCCVVQECLPGIRVFLDCDARRKLSGVGLRTLACIHNGLHGTNDVVSSVNVFPRFSGRNMADVYAEALNTQ